MKIKDIYETKNKLEFSMLCLEKLNHVPSDTSFRNWADGSTNPGGVYISLLKDFGVTDV